MRTLPILSLHIALAILLTGCSASNNEISKRQAQRIAVSDVKPDYKAYGRLLAPYYTIESAERNRDTNWVVVVLVKGNKLVPTRHTVVIDRYGVVQQHTKKVRNRKR